ncbi:MAG: DUF2029 domain-containing protein [Anaerolineales bacterium]|nr:DUF2029 domain-containing protein [Anaerolineales bacterium]
MTSAAISKKLRIVKRSLPGFLANPLLALAIVAGLSLLVYIVLLVRPLLLSEYVGQGRLDGIYLSRDKPYNQVRLLIASLLLGGLYLGGWLAIRQAHGRPAWLVTLAGAFACAASLLFMAPFDAADIYDNIVHARILGVYGGNPYVQVGKDFRTDPFYEYMAWKKNPSAYGPVWELLAGGTARVVGDDLIANVLAFKLLPGVFWLASLGIVAGFLFQVAPGQALAGVYLLAWNPIVLFSTFGNGHNDVAMLFWVLLAAWLLVRGRHTASILALLVGALVKYLPLLLLPAAGLIAWRQTKEPAARLRFLALTAIAGLALVWLAYRPFWAGLETLTIERRTRLFTTSLPSVLYHLSVPALGEQRAAHAISLVAASLTGVFALWRGWRASLDHEPTAFPVAAFDIMTFYLLLTCLWFQHWYTVWIVGVAAILPQGYRQRFAAFFSLAALSKQLLVGPWLFQPKPILQQPELEILFTLGTLGLPWLYWLAAYSTSLRSKARDIAPPLDAP